MIKWRKISSKVLFEHPRLNLVEDTIELPNGEQAKYLKFTNIDDSVSIMAFDEQGKLLLCREYSYPPDEVMHQLPGGGIEQGEDVLVAANRELAEEGGFEADELEVIGYFHTMNRRSSQKQYVVVAQQLHQVEASSDPEEFIESHWFAMAEVEQMIQDGHITNVNLLAALSLYRSRS